MIIITAFILIALLQSKGSTAADNNSGMNSNSIGTVGSVGNVPNLNRTNSSSTRNKSLFPTKALLTWVNGMGFHMEQMNFLFPPKTVLTWVNGIGYNMDHMNDGQVDISSIFGNKPVLFCHNPTAMVDEDDTKGYIGDLTQGLTQKYLGKCTTEVDELERSVTFCFNLFYY